MMAMKWENIPNTIAARTEYLKANGKHYTQRDAKSLGWHFGLFANDAAYQDRQDFIYSCREPWPIRVARMLWRSLWGPLLFSTGCAALIAYLALTITG